MSKLYKGFTLVEMLIVMGIVVLLMAIGIVSARAIMDSANDTAHQAAVKQIYTALVTYNTQNGSYPNSTNGCTSAACDVKDLLTGQLSTLIGNFDGGNDATFYYMSDGSVALVCVSLGGIGDSAARGLACEGDGFNTLPTTAPATGKSVASGTATYNAIKLLTTNASDWEAKAWK